MTQSLILSGLLKHKLPSLPGIYYSHWYPKTTDTRFGPLLFVIMKSNQNWPKYLVLQSEGMQCFGTHTQIPYVKPLPLPHFPLLRTSQWIEWMQDLINHIELMVFIGGSTDPTLHQSLAIISPFTGSYGPRISDRENMRWMQTKIYVTAIKLASYVFLTGRWTIEIEQS